MIAFFRIFNFYILKYLKINYYFQNKSRRLSFRNMKCSHFQQWSLALAFGPFCTYTCKALFSSKFLFLWISVGCKEISLILSWVHMYTFNSSPSWFYFNADKLFMLNKAHFFCKKKNSDKDTLKPTILPVKSFSLAPVESKLWADTLLPSVPYQNA